MGPKYTPLLVSISNTNIICEESVEINVYPKEMLVIQHINKIYRYKIAPIYLRHLKIRLIRILEHKCEPHE